MPNRKATLRSQWLGRQLRQLRGDELTLEDAAAHIHRDASGLSRMESGQLTVPETDLQALMDLYGLRDPAQREALHRLNSEVWKTDWYVEAGNELVDYVWVERRAVAIRSYCPTLIDGLLQTASYARALIEARSKGHPEAEHTEQWVEMRMARKVVFDRPEPPLVSAVFDEGVLRRQVGGPGVMGPQLRHLIEAAERNNVEVLVLPYAAGEHANMASNFRLYVMPEPFDEIVAVESEAGTAYLEPPGSARYVADYNALLDKSLGADESTALIRQLADEMERK